MKREAPISGKAAVKVRAELRRREEALKERDLKIKRLESAILWALGEGPNDHGEHFDPPSDASPRYWWRHDLRRMLNGAVAGRSR